MSDKPELIKADLGAYASRIYKFTIYNEENFMENPLKFIHINNDSRNQQSRYSNNIKRKFRSRTVAALSLSPNAVRKLAIDFLSNTSDQPTLASMVIGVQIVSLDDNYNKATGRDMSVKKMKEIDLKVVDAKINDDFITIKLETHESIDLSIRLNKKTGFSTIYGRLSPF